ncbi:type II secretion system protein GspL [Marinomonas sp. PE14-40]|uniref:type II secretion system protein GspL n=1 Tax=Marinomonas sp. PE14-40 TaxID=3060621 RepID=UPI003F67056E
MNRLYIRTIEAQSETNSEEEVRTYALADQFEWLLLAPSSDVLNAGKDKTAAQLQEALKELNLTYGELIFIPPEHRVQVRRVELAKGQHRHAGQVIPFLLEESLGQSPDELHYTLLNKSDKDHQWVSVVAKEVMNSWVQDLTDMGWQHACILAVNNMLPFWPEQDGDIDFIFTSTDNLLYKDQDSVSCLPLSAQSFLPKREKYQVCCDLDTQEDFQVLAGSLDIVSPWSNHRANEKGKLETWLYVVATKVQTNSQFFMSNLCHGEFGRQTQVLTRLKPWIWVLVFALFSLGTELYLTIKKTNELNAQADTIYQKSSQAFLKLAPDEGRVSYLDRQIKGRIQRAKQGLGQTKKSLTVYEVMAMVDQVRAKVAGEHRITKFDYANQEYRLDWQAEQREVLDAIQSALEKEPLEVVFEQVAKRGEKYVASIKLKAETK